MKIGAWIINSELENYHFPQLIKTFLPSDHSFNLLLQKRLSVTKSSSSSSSTSPSPSTSTNLSTLVHNMLLCYRLQNIMEMSMRKAKLLNVFNMEMQLISSLAKMEFYGLSFDYSYAESSKSLLKLKKKQIQSECELLLGRKLILSSPADVGSSLPLPTSFLTPYTYN